MNQSLFSQFAVLFVVTCVLGLLVASTFIHENVQVTIVNADKESIENPIGLFAYILLATGVLLVLIKLLPKRSFLVFKILEGFALFYMVPVVLWALLVLFFNPVEFSAALEPLAILFIILRNAVPDHVLLRNAATIILAAGIGAVLGTGIGTIPILMFLAVMSIYDYIAVFKTKHMVTLAKAVTEKNLSFTFALPTPDHQFELGTGDIVLPLAFAVSVLHQYAGTLAYPNYWLPPIVILGAAFVGLFITINYASKRIGKALPALPIQAILMILAYAAMQFLI
ncbi:MAG: presenilin family intramembrane aspartyl protease [Candidatus Diapherotrites archaeon]|nr:presenilin family intramembrane aspartyl protease [Candidatus Diapherotrites archaeon]